MTFRPTPLVYVLFLTAAWAFCLGVALGRAEMFFIALPSLLALLRARAPVPQEVTGVQLSLDLEPAEDSVLEDEVLAMTVMASVPGWTGAVQVHPVLPPVVTSDTPAAVVSLPGADGRVVWKGRLRCRGSGSVDLGVVFFRAWDDAGLWVGDWRHEARRTISVLPRAVPVRCLPRPRRAKGPFGDHRSQSLGDGPDFAAVRPFMTGDQVRRINWPVSLRLNRLHVNQFLVERAGDVILLIDCLANYGSVPSSTLDHCRRAAAALALGYLRQNHRVGLLAYSGLVDHTPMAAGAQQYARLRGALTRVATIPTVFRRDLTQLPEAMLPPGALIIVLTPLVDDAFSRMLGRLAAQGRDIAVIALRTDEVCAHIAPRSVTHPWVRRMWLLERAEQLRNLRRLGMRAVNWSPSLPIETALLKLGRPVALPGGGH